MGWDTSKGKNALVADMTKVPHTLFVSLNLFQYKAVSSYSRGDNTSPNGTPQSLLFHTFELLQTARRYACRRQRGCLPASPEGAWRAPSVPEHHGIEFAADKRISESRTRRRRTPNDGRRRGVIEHILCLHAPFPTLRNRGVFRPNLPTQHLSPSG